VDVDFVRKAVRSIGRLAVKIESGAQRCIAALIELIETKVNYVVQEAIVVIKVRVPKYSIDGGASTPPFPMGSLY
jgi:AP-2 complex subunit beta-1